MRKEKNPCSLCARMRRGALHDWMVENGYNKLALGHHADDAIETLLMSLLYEGRLYTFQPVTYLSRKDYHGDTAPHIRHRKGYHRGGAEGEPPGAEEPLSGGSRIPPARRPNRMLKALYKTHPQARERIMHALENKEQTRLWFY